VRLIPPSHPTPRLGPPTPRSAPLVGDRQRFMLPTGTTRRVPRVIPAYTLLPMPPSSAIPSFTPKHGQYLAFIYACKRVLGRPPAEADLQRHFGVSPALRPPNGAHPRASRAGSAGNPGWRSIEILIAVELLPILR
jgi:hypothetical protein